MEHVIAETVNYIKNIFLNDFSGHDYFHSLRVYRVAGTIAEQENADMEIVSLAALLHDVDERKLSPETYEKKEHAFAYGGNHNRAIYDPAIVPKFGMSKDEYQDHVTTSINHFYEKLFLLKDMMSTDTGRKIAEKRERFMREYVDEFMAEWDGKDY